MYSSVSRAMSDATLETFFGADFVNDALANDSAHNKADNAIKGLAKAAQPLVPGTVLSRKFSFPNASDMPKFLASEGAVLSEFGIISSSVSQPWSGNIHLRIVAAEGSKGLFVAYDPSGKDKPISVNPGEDEVILPYKSRFYIKKIHPEGHSFTDEHGTWGGGSKRVVEVVLLPD
jgi:hypothetical protein